MSPRRLDCHGLRYDEALRRIEALIFSSDRARDDFEVEIITGVGEIREGVIQLLERHGYEWHHPRGNTGCLLIHG